MKTTGIIFLFFISHYSFAQKTETFYDYYWKPSTSENARYYSTVEKTDSGWLRHDYYISSQRLQMRALYSDEDCKIQNGDCLYYYANGLPSEIGRKINDKREGVYTRYHANGMIADSALYRSGRIVDKRFRWHPNGYMSDSIRRINDSVDVHIGWFDDGNLAYAGYLLHGDNDKKWKYYHHNGLVSAVEIYAKGKQISAEYFDEEGKLLTDTSAVNRRASLKGGEAAWIKYLEKKLYWPHQLEFTVPAAVTVGISFVVDENGKITNAEVSTPFHEAFDKIALKIIENSPDWQPAISHNRKVKAYHIQPVTFVQPE